MTKNGLRGFAGGLIVATFILSYVYYFQVDKTDANENGQNITKEDVENYALENNLIILTEEEFNQTNDANETDTEPANKDENEKKEEPKEEQKQVVNVNFEITPGMSSEAVGSKLQDLKVISNKNDFTNYIKNQKLEASVKAGTFKLNSEMTVEEIVAILTK